jgi:hypothetical protein
MGDVLPAWLQNLLGNVITLNAIQTKIDDAEENSDRVALFYWYGRLANILLIFEPVDTDSFNGEDLPDFNRLSAKLNQGFDTPPTPYTDDNEEEVESVDLPGNYFTNAFYFTRGFTDTAFKGTSPNSTICEGNLTMIAYTAKAVKDSVFETEDGAVMGQNAIEFQMLLETVYPITFSCYYAGYEMKATMDNYLENFGQQDAMMYNSVHKLGSLYDAIYYLRKHIALDRAEILTYSEMGVYWYKTGAYVGLILSIVLYTPAGGI